MYFLTENVVHSSERHQFAKETVSLLVRR